MIKAVFFDAVGTLIHLPRSVGEHYREVASRFGANLDAAALDKAFRQAWADSPGRTREQGPRDDDDKGWWRGLVGRVLRIVLTAEEAKSLDEAAYFEAVYAHFAEPGVWEAYPDAHPTLEKLRDAGLALGVISNFDRRLYRVFEHLALTPYFDAMIISSEVGADKPDPLIFQRALSALKVASEETLHVGDDPKRDWGAEALGLRVFRLDRPRNSLHDVLACAGREENLQPARGRFK